MIVLNSTKLNGKQYTVRDLQHGFVQKMNELVPTGFYGGRVNNLAKTDIKGVYLCIEQDRIIDIVIPQPKELTKEALEAVAKEKGINIPDKATKTDILKLLEG